MQRQTRTPIGGVRHEHSESLHRIRYLDRTHYCAAAPAVRAASARERLSGGRVSCSRIANSMHSAS